MQKGLVTVVVPVYKTEKYLDRCISSIVNQTYHDLEILLIDDGSPDHCPELCDAWARKDHRIRVIHKENEGLGMARNTGMDHAHGEFICFFDSDDYVAEDTIEKAYVCAAANEAQIVVFGLCNVNRNGVIVTRDIPQGPMAVYTGAGIRTQFLPDLINGGHRGAKIKNLCMSACSAMFSMALIQSASWRFVSEREIISEDSFSLMRLYGYVERVAILPDALYYYCDNSNSLTHTYREDRFEKCKQYYHRCVEVAREQGYCEEVEKSISGVFVAFSIAAMKQIAGANISIRRKFLLLKNIVSDQVLYQAVEKIQDRDYGRSRNLLAWAVTKKLHGLCIVLIMAHSKRKNRVKNVG